MNRRSFVRDCALGTVGMGMTQAGRLTARPPAENSRALEQLGFGAVLQRGMPVGVRRLSSEKNFTIYRAGLVPSYAVKLEEVVLIECQHGLPGLVTREGSFRKPKAGDKINPGTGPIFVEGIEPGDTLAVDLLNIRVGEWGYCAERIFELSDGFLHIDPNFRLPLQPMIGQVGVTPATGEADTKAPADTGGNLDCREVRAGSTLVFTAQVQGALLGMGDPHALQGDGEISGQGVETDAEVLVCFRKLPDKLSDRPVILRPEFVATLSAMKDLTDACWQATDDMVSMLARWTGRKAEEARILVNLAGNLRVNQIVDPTKGARMELPTWVFGSAGK